MTLPKTLVDAVRSIAHHQERGFLFVRPDGSERLCSFAYLNEESERRAAHLTSRGVVKGDRVAIVVAEGDEFVLSFLGAIFAGAVPVPMVPQLSFKDTNTYKETIVHILKASAATVLVTTAAAREFIAPLLEQVPSLREVVLATDFAEPAPPYRAVPVTPDDLAFLQFTSGSTSQPKGVMVTHANLAANSECFMVHGLKKDSSFDKGVSWLPLFHDMGLIGFVIGPLFTDIPVVFLPTASFVRSPRLWLETIHKHRGTITFAPNFAYALVAKRLRDKDVAELDLSCLRSAGCGAEPVQARTLESFAEKLAPTGFKSSAFLPSYGMAEATLAITFTTHGQGLLVDEVDGVSLQKGAPRKTPKDSPGNQRLVGCGVPFPGHEVRIISETGEVLADRYVGQVIARGPSVTSGYYDAPELTADAFRNGWLHTGDLGYTDHGQLFLCGRLKDLIIVRGKNFYPSDIEWKVGDLPGIRRGNVIAIGVDVDGEEQLVVCAEATRSDLPGLTDAVNSCVGGAFGLTVHDVLLLPAGTLPRTSSGKPQRRKARELYRTGELLESRLRLDVTPEDRPNFKQIDGKMSSESPTD